jgi:hypothetical protein
MNEKSEQCEFFYPNPSGYGLIQCPNKVTDTYKFEDGTKITVCEKHLQMILDQVDFYGFSNFSSML